MQGINQPPMIGVLRKLFLEGGFSLAASHRVYCTFLWSISFQRLSETGYSTRQKNDLTLSGIFYVPHILPSFADPRDLNRSDTDQASIWMSACISQPKPPLNLFNGSYLSVDHSVFSDKENLALRCPGGSRYSVHSSVPKLCETNWLEAAGLLGVNSNT